MIEWTDTITDELLDRWIDSFKGYRIPERESVKTPYDRDKVGRGIYFNRAIVRTGYRIMPQDIPEIDVQSLTMKWMTHYSGKSEKDIEEIVSLLGSFNPYRNVKYNIRGQLRHHLIARYRERFPDIDTTFRTFWYQDYTPEMSPYYTKGGCIYAYVEQVVHRQIGSYNAGSIYISSEDDYEPPYLSQKLSQPLYKVSLSWIPIGWTERTVYVHPLDVITEEK